MHGVTISWYLNGFMIALNIFLQLKFILCVCISLRKKKDLEKWAWKYLIADKIEFNLKAVYERNAVFKEWKAFKSPPNPQSFMHVNWSFEIYQTSTLRNAKRKRQVRSYRERVYMRGDENSVLGPCVSGTKLLPMHYLSYWESDNTDSHTWTRNTSYLITEQTSLNSYEILIKYTLLSIYQKRTTTTMATTAPSQRRGW